MKSTITLVVCAAVLANAQFVPPPAPVLLTETKSGVLPVLPTPFSGVETLQGAIIMKAPVNASYTPVNGPAMTQSAQPAATYSATLPSTAFNELTGTVIKGSVMGSSSEGATGTTWTIMLSDLPDVAQYGPFVYHVHDMPVPSDGNCTATMGHFDPTNAGEYYTCDTANPQNCQAGDLAGKHGKIMSGPTFTTTFTDNFLSTDPNSQYFFGAKSIVIHSMNTTRLTCANFMMASGGGAASGTQTGAPVATFTGIANVNAVSGGALAGGIAAVLAWLL